MNRIIIKKYREVSGISSYRCILAGRICKPETWKGFYTDETSLDAKLHDGVFFLKNQIPLSCFPHVDSSVIAEAKEFFELGYTYEAYFCFHETKLRVPQPFDPDSYSKMKIGVLSDERLAVFDAKPTFKNLCNFIGEDTARELRESQFHLQTEELTQVAYEYEDDDSNFIKRVKRILASLEGREIPSELPDEEDSFETNSQQNEIFVEEISDDEEVESDYVFPREGVWIDPEFNSDLTTDQDEYLSYKENLVEAMVKDDTRFCLVNPDATESDVVYYVYNPTFYHYGTSLGEPVTEFGSVDPEFHWLQFIEGIHEYPKICDYDINTRMLYPRLTHDSAYFRYFISDMLTTRFVHHLDSSVVTRLLLPGDPRWLHFGRKPGDVVFLDDSQYCFRLDPDEENYVLRYLDGLGSDLLSTGSREVG
jgi:hypothetical protein